MTLFVMSVMDNSTGGLMKENVNLSLNVNLKLMNTGLNKENKSA
jgi:hypothetical protein